MVSKIVTDYLRDLAKRLDLGAYYDANDVTQLIDLADTLDDERLAIDKEPEYDPDGINRAIRKLL